MRNGLAGLATAAAITLLGPAQALASINYSSAAFKASTYKVTFGQAPVFLPDGKVAFGQDLKQGEKNQVYIENWDGTGRTCLTCTDVPDPGSGNDSSSDPNNVNGVPAVQPVPAGTPIDHIWIIFHSWRGHYMTIGSAGYGGMGSSLWAMHPDGSDQTRLTDTNQSNFSGEGYDDYHAYWSPDGTHIEYAHLNWNFATGGGSGRWDIRVAKFNVDPKTGKPVLSNDHEVRPANGHWYETQWWNPDPKHPGFLYTESSGEASGSGGGVSVPQLYYCALPSLDQGSCKATRLTDDAAWDEQAIFIPGTDHVLFMSSRDHDGLFNTWANATRTAGLPSDYDYLFILPVFEAGFLQPVGQEATDLYETSLSHPATVRRLTWDGSDGWITPEFTWDPSDRCLVWTENRFPDGYRYQFSEGLSGWISQLQDLLSNPPDPSSIVDVGQNGVGVAPVSVQQRTRIASFAGSHCGL